MGGSGVQRPLKFVKYLREFGWNPIVLCPEPGAYHVFDESLQQELDKMEVEVHRVEGKTPLHLTGNRRIVLPKWFENVLRKISTFFWLPDNKKAWIKKGFVKAEEIINSRKIDVIFASAPPYSNLILAKKLKEKFTIPTVMDLRDDWLESHLIKYPTSWHYNKMKQIESNALSFADQLVTINNYISASVDNRNVNPNKTKVITQGFDPDDFEIEVSSAESSQRLSFLYSGTFYPKSGPEVFLSAMATFLDRDPKYKDLIELQFQGVLSDYDRSLFKKFNLLDNVKDFGFVSHKNSLENLLAADILWLNNTHPKNPEMLSLGKTYEYMATEKPILALVPEGDVKKTLESYGAASIVPPDKVEEVVEKISELVLQWEKKKLPTPDKVFISRFNRRELTSQLASIFNVISR